MWRSTVWLGTILSLIVAAACSLLVGRVSDHALIIGSFLVASVLGWANVERFADHQRRPVPVTRR